MKFAGHEEDEEGENDLNDEAKTDAEEGPLDEVGAAPTISPTGQTGTDELDGPRRRALSLHQTSLEAAQLEQEHVLGLKEGDAKGQVDAHDPPLEITRIDAVEEIDHHDGNQVAVEGGDGGDGQGDAPDANAGQVPQQNQGDDPGEEDDGPEDDDDDVDLGGTIAVQGWAQVEGAPWPEDLMGHGGSRGSGIC